MPKKRIVVLSASADSIYKKCPWAYQLRYITGWKPDKDKEAFRIGTNWHKCHEILDSEPESNCQRCISQGNIGPDCYLCAGTGQLPTDLMESVIGYMDYFYNDMPDGFDQAKWDTEKYMILYAVSGYAWHYQAKEFDVIATELPFSLPIINPDTGRKLPSARLDGIIDELWKHRKTGLIYIGERKSTTSSLGGDGTFWERLALNTQVTTYLYAARMLQLGGALEFCGVSADDPLIQSAFYDVWRKPDIRPKGLTQADSKAFVETGEYFGASFDVKLIHAGCKGVDDANDTLGYMQIDNIKKTVYPAKKAGAYTIRETPEMYGNRVLANIEADPELCFERREIPRSEDALLKFARDCVKMVNLLRYSEKECAWMQHESNCKLPFKCDYYGACHQYADHPLDPHSPPEGYVGRTKKEDE